MPAALLRDATDTSTARPVKPSAGGNTDAQASVTRVSASPGESRLPDRLMIGSGPMKTAPAATLLTAKAVTARNEKATATRTFPANTSCRLRERVSTVAQVP